MADNEMDAATDEVMVLEAAKLEHDVRSHNGDTLDYWTFVGKCLDYLRRISYDDKPDETIRLVRGIHVEDGQMALFSENSDGIQKHIIMHWSDAQHRMFVRRLTTKDWELTLSELEG